MLKFFKTARCPIGFCAIASSAIALSACGTFWAGGVDEETNTVAGANTEDRSNYDLVASADSIDVNIDTLHIPVQEVHTPIKSDPQLVISDPPMIGSCEEDTYPATNIPVNSFTGKLNNTNGEALNITVKLYGGDVNTTTDASGYFKLQDLPIGIYPMIVTSEKSEIAYLLKNNSSNEEILGPVPSSAISTVDASDFEEPALQNFNYIDEGTSVGAPDPQPEPDPDPESSSATTGYQSSASEKEPVAATIDLPHDFDYGVINQWSNIENGSIEADLSNDNRWPEEWTVEVNFELSSIDAEGSYTRNLFGKFENESGVIRLAIINGVCGTKAPSFALYISSYGEFSCNYAVISTATVETGKKISLTGTFDGKALKLYKDGFKIAEKIRNFYGLQSYSKEQFVFGDENLNLKLNDVRLGEKAITSADVLYRYYR